jgi:hypothetical protein
VAETLMTTSHKGGSSETRTLIQGNKPIRLEVRPARVGGENSLSPDKKPIPNTRDQTSSSGQAQSILRTMADKKPFMLSVTSDNVKSK